MDNNVENNPQFNSQSQEKELDQSNTKKPEHKLYQISGVVIATLFGGVLAGGILMAVNYKRMGKPQCVIPTIAISIVTLLCAIFLSYILPERFPSLLLSIPQLIAISYLMKNLQEASINHHTHNGGLMESNWLAFGISLVVMLLVLAVSVAVLWPLL